MNILFLMTDQQRKDMLGCYGHPHACTPNLDRIAQSGVRFDQAFTTCPLCTPARAGLFTGMWPSSAGFSSNQDIGYRGVTFLGEHFSHHGIACGYTGKWHLSGTEGGYYGDGKADGGFPAEYWYDGRNFINEVGEDGFERWHAGRGLTDEDCWGTRVADRTIAFMEAHREQPFFFVASFDEPHGPSSAPERYYEMWDRTDRERLPSLDDDLASKPLLQQRLVDEFFNSNGVVEPGVRPGNNRRYFGCNSYVDDQIGRILDAIERLGLSKDTAVVYTSDHGDHQGAHKLLAKGPTMYDDTINVPLLVRIPGETTPGSTSTAPLSHIDLAPTLCDLAGIPPHPQFAGTSRRATWAKPTDASPQLPVFLEYNRFGITHDNHGGFYPIRCIRTATHKLVLNLYDRDEFYRTDDNQHEITNLIDDLAHAEERNRLHDELLAWMEQRRDPLRGEGWHSRPWRPHLHLHLATGKPVTNL